MHQAPKFGDFNSADYDYELPPERIAARPAEQRTDGRLLLANCADGAITHEKFNSLPQYVPGGAMLVVNQTRVIAARLHMHKLSGGAAEIFLLKALAPSDDPAVTLAAQNSCTWRCMLGGRRLHEGTQLQRTVADIQLRATILKRQDGEADVQLEWNKSDTSFAEILDVFGHTPLPPYIKREADDADVQRYQTVYAKRGGSVAAPTAGLHFNTDLLSELSSSGVQIERLTLHVGAGTFKPLSSSDPAKHVMHSEQIIVPRATLQNLIRHCKRREEHGTARHPLIPVGTTSVRTLESLYWFGTQLHAGTAKTDATTMQLDQWAPYDSEGNCHAALPASAALQEVKNWLEEQGVEQLLGETQLMILPGYRFQMCDALITNFHQPGSSLILLVAALLGRKLWREVYRAALDGPYRFLSYGDSSMLIGPQLGATPTQP